MLKWALAKIDSTYKASSEGIVLWNKKENQN